SASDLSFENRRSKIENPLAVFQNNSFQRIPHVLTPIDRILDVVVQLFPLHYFQRLNRAVEEMRHRGVMVVVADAFFMVNLDQLVAELRKLVALAKAMNRV